MSRLTMMSGRRGSRRPIILTISLSVLLGYMAWSLGNIYFVVRADIEHQHRTIDVHLRKVGQDALFLLDNNDIDELETILQPEVDRQSLSGYRLRSDDTILLMVDPDKVIASGNLQVPVENKILHQPEVAYVELASGPHKLLLIARKWSAAEYFRLQAPLFLRDFAIVALIATFIIAYFFRDISAALKVFRDGNDARASRRAYRGISARSAEGEMLLKGLSALESGMSELQAQNRQLHNQVLPALRSELLSGRTPPYEFECTLVRVDVNNFSHIFSHYPIEEFMTVINSFFTSVTEIVSRYKGYVCEFIGDEVIFYFKDEEHGNSAAIALSALRDINLEAERLDSRVKPAHGYHFYVKSSVAHGRLRFGPQVSGYTLAGAILIETVRVLSQISEKEKNVILYEEDIAHRVDFLVRSRPQKVVKLKGLKGARSLFAYVDHLSVSDALSEIMESAPQSDPRFRIQSQTDGQTDGQTNKQTDRTDRQVNRRTATAIDTRLLGHFRSDHDLARILNALVPGINEQPIDTTLFLAIVRRLRSLKVPRPTDVLKSAYQHLLEALMRRLNAPDVDESDLFKLSSSLMLALHFLDEESFLNEFRSFFAECLQCQDRRIIANSLDVFSRFSALDADKVFHELLRHRDNRVVANALVKDGMCELSRKLLKRTGKMLSSSDPRFVASGLYVIGELAQHYRTTNFVSFETNLGLQALIQRVRRFIGSDNEMIRRQALLAARKSQNETLRKAIEDFYLNAADAKMKTEIEKLYLHPDAEEQEPPATTATASPRTKRRVA